MASKVEIAERRLPKALLRLEEARAKVEKVMAEEQSAITLRHSVPEWFEDRTRCGYCVYAKVRGRNWRCGKHNVTITWQDSCAEHASV